MPMTNAQRQSGARKRRAEKIVRYEAALREIEWGNDDGSMGEWAHGYACALQWAGDIASKALNRAKDG